MQKKSKRTIKEIKEALPELDSTKVEDISDELDRVLALKRLFKSEGGEMLITFLRNNCASNLRKLVATAKEKPELSSLLTIIFEYSSNMDLLQTLGDLSLEEELREQLDQAVKDAMA